ncbi:ATP-binding protein [Amycolatopsis pigmentata]|uniref:AAA family ATPase n=1 Tax=Amycolatopsis pigmentata TaxID=450801 RepID=A0ABW5G178_9PSEU
MKANALAESARNPPADTDRNRRIISAILARDSARPLVTVTGPVGSGRSTLLDQLCAALSGQGVRPLLLRLSPNPIPTPLYSALRSIDGPPGDGGGQPSMWWSPVDPLTGTHAAATPRHTAAAIAEPLTAAGDVAILIDDAQWMDPHSLAVVDHLARRLAGTSVLCVCAVRVPVTGPMFAAGCATLDALRAENLLHEVNLRPLGEADIGAVAAAAFNARPDPELVTHLRRLTGGLPAALVPAIDAYRRAEEIRVVDGYAHLAPRHNRPTLPANHQLLLSVRRNGPLTWSVAKAVAVLHPLGDAAPKLLGEALGVAETKARQVLGELRDAGVLRHSARGRRWRFRVPLLASALSAQLGPFERRHLAQRAITALWQGNADCDDPDYRADQLAIAGKMVDPARAKNDLLSHAAKAGAYDDRWLRSAAALSTDQSDRARTLLTQAMLCLAHGDYRQTLVCAETICRELDGQLSDDESGELDRIRVLASHAVGDKATLKDLAADPDPRRVVARATALLLLGRWRECGTLVAGSREEWTSGPLSASSGHLVEALTHFVSGSHLLAERCAEEAYRQLSDSAERRQARVAGMRVLMKLIGNGVAAVEDLPSTPALPASARAVLAAHQGRFDEAMELARRAIASGTIRGHDLTHTFLHEAAATIQLSRGKLTGGRELLMVAREAETPLPYLLDGAEALIDRALGQPDQARKRLLHGVGYAGERDLVIGTDTLLLQLAELAMDRGELAAARRYMLDIERVATRSGTPGTALTLALARALVERDAKASEDAIRLARELGRPYQLAEVIARLVTHKQGDPALLAEAYEILGELGALLNRAWLRNLMQEHGVSIPGRRQTVAENERLLSILVADGLANKQIATVLGTSEKSVEGRLARLFSRTGYRSRVELAMSVLTGLGG